MEKDCAVSFIHLRESESTTARLVSDRRTTKRPTRELAERRIRSRLQQGQCLRRPKCRPLLPNFSVSVHTTCWVGQLACQITTTTRPEKSSSHNFFHHRLFFRKLPSKKSFFSLDRPISAAVTSYYPSASSTRALRAAGSCSLDSAALFMFRGRQ